MTSLAFWTILIGTLASVSCALVGCFLVLRRMSLLGDAISHAVLPGIAVGFLLSGKINGPAIILGAMALGLLTAYLTQALGKAVKVAEDASLGVVFTSLFALGVVLISVKTKHADLDAGCVLYGVIEMTPIVTSSYFGMELPDAAVILTGMLLFIVVCLVAFWKEFKLASFDPELATTLGFSANFLHYFLMALTAGVTVAAFQVVGSILVVAMLIIPAATAQLLTDRLRTMLLLSALLGTLATVLGYAFAVYWNTSVAGMMAVAAGGLFLLALGFAPQYGIIAKLLKQWQWSLRVLREDILGTLYRAKEQGELGLQIDKLLPRQSSWMKRLSLRKLHRQGLIALQRERVTLTAAGSERAQQLIRAHRLWETYLQQNVALPADHLHAPAEKMEHYVGPELLESLATDLHAPAIDPHGRTIP